jgi:RNA polymerase sigma-54 factor
VPDIFVEKIDGKYIVIVNDYNFPRLMINHVYQKVMRERDLCSQDVRKYLEDKMGSAVWLIRSIEQRRMTLYKVARCIVDIQRDFLDKGIEYLKPLKLSQVAELVEVHESTVSRATANKYIQTCRGLFELKYFFSTGVESSGKSQQVSSKSIKHMVEELINNEDTVHPLSDQAITQILTQKGISISRRTVAKYRKEMGIQSTVIRKRYKG